MVQKRNYNCSQKKYHVKKDKNRVVSVGRSTIISDEEGNSKLSREKFIYLQT